MISPPESEWMLWAMRFKIEHQTLKDRIGTLETECAALRVEREQQHIHASSLDDILPRSEFHQFPHLHHHILMVQVLKHALKRPLQRRVLCP